VSSSRSLVDTHHIRPEGFSKQTTALAYRFFGALWEFHSLADMVGVEVNPHMYCAWTLMTIGLGTYHSAFPFLRED
jgi:hypothetical protein